MSKGNKHDKHEAKHEAKEARHDAQQDRQDIKELFAELKEADEFYIADFNALDESGVEGYALITVDRGGPGAEDDTVTVRIAATGLDEGTHLQHIHGFENGTEAVTPTVEQHDEDGDGFVELLEGAPAYGPVLLNLRPFPVITEDEGSFIFEGTFHLPSGDPNHDGTSHEGDTITTFDNLDLNHLVIHGMRVEDGEGAGTFGEVGDEFILVGGQQVPNPLFDPDEFKDLLPVSVAEIEEVSLGQAHQFLKQAYSEGFDFMA